MLEDILAKQSAMFLPGIPLIKYSGKTELDFGRLLTAFSNRGIDPKLVLVERDEAVHYKKFSILKGLNYRKQIDFTKIFPNPQGITFEDPDYIHANEDAMVHTVGLALINLLKKI